MFADVTPASTMAVVAGLLEPRWVVEVELDAIVAEDRSSVTQSGSAGHLVAVWQPC